MTWLYRRQSCPQPGCIPAARPNRSKQHTLGHSWRSPRPPKNQSCQRRSDLSPNIHVLGTGLLHYTLGPSRTSLKPSRGEAISPYRHPQYSPPQVLALKPLEAQHLRLVLGHPLKLVEGVRRTSQLHHFKLLGAHHT